MGFHKGVVMLMLVFCTGEMVQSSPNKPYIDYSYPYSYGAYVPEPETTTPPAPVPTSSYPTAPTYSRPPPPKNPVPPTMVSYYPKPTQTPAPIRTTTNLPVTSTYTYPMPTQTPAPVTTTTNYPVAASHNYPMPTQYPAPVRTTTIAPVTSTTYSYPMPTQYPTTVKTTTHFPKAPTQYYPTPKPTQTPAPAPASSYSPKPISISYYYKAPDRSTMAPPKSPAATEPSYYYPTAPAPTSAPTTKTPVPHVCQTPVQPTSYTPLSRPQIPAKFPSPKPRESSTPSSSYYYAPMTSTPAPTSAPPAVQILKLEHQIMGTEEDHFDFTSGNGIHSSESTLSRVVPTFDATSDLQTKSGRVHYTSPEGYSITLNYLADNNGYQPQMSIIAPADMHRNMANQVYHYKPTSTPRPSHPDSEEARGDEARGHSKRLSMKPHTSARFMSMHDGSASFQSVTSPSLRNPPAHHQRIRFSSFDDFKSHSA